MWLRHVAEVAATHGSGAAGSIQRSSQRSVGYTRWGETGWVGEIHVCAVGGLRAAESNSVLRLLWLPG